MFNRQSLKLGLVPGVSRHPQQVAISPTAPGQMALEISSTEQHLLFVADEAGFRVVIDRMDGDSRVPKRGILHSAAASKELLKEGFISFSFKFRNIARINALRERRHIWIELQRP
jgi:hypothetical protein